MQVRQQGRSGVLATDHGVGGKLRPVATDAFDWIGCTTMDRPAGRRSMGRPCDDQHPRGTSGSCGTVAVDLQSTRGMAMRTFSRYRLPAVANVMRRG